jgi:membrane fusion protein (multidrug efflux system)
MFSAPEKLPMPQEPVKAPTTDASAAAPGRIDAIDRPPANEVGTKKPRRRVRWPVLAAAGGVLVVAGLVYWLWSRQFESTDDAQVDADISNIGARVAGTVARVDVVENQPVRAGQILVELDPTDLEVALAQARAQVSQATAQLAAEDPNVPITETTNTTALTNASANVSSATAALAGARADADQAAARLAEAQANQRTSDLELQRGEQLARHGAIPRADLDRRESAASAAAAVVEGAEKSVAAARERIAQQRALMAGVRSRADEVRENSPRQLDTRKATLAVRRANLDLAEAQERQAELNRGYAVVRTPVAGIVARKAVSVGDMVSPGQAIAAVSQTGNVWVTANYRETQLRRMHAGQRATIHVDALSRDFGGLVESLGGATGSRVSVFPPENATGNYVKVVQRIPVRIRLDAGQPELDRLRPGMSVVPKVRVSE